MGSVDRSVLPGSHQGSHYANTNGHIAPADQNAGYSFLYAVITDLNLFRDVLKNCEFKYG